MSFTSYAQNFEDVLLRRALHDVARGRYIDIGAQDPIVDSISLCFYEIGWRGIHVEPIPAYAAKLRAARPDEVVLEAVVSSTPGPVEFFEIPGTGLSTGRGDIAEGHAAVGYAFNPLYVPSITLENLLDKAGGEVHWLKIDVEGMEADVLRSWGKNELRPWILVIEATAPNTQQQTHDGWIEEVLRRGYAEAFFDGLSRYFVHEEHAELVSRITTPANVFDGFSVAPHHFSAGVLQRELHALGEQLRDEQAQAVRLHADLSTAQQARDEQRKQALHDLAVAEEAHRVAFQGLQGQHDELQAQLRLAQEDRLAATQQHQDAVRRLAEVEREWRCELDKLWREYHETNVKLREEFSERESALQAAAVESQAQLGAARADLARMEEAAQQLRSQMESHRRTSAQAGALIRAAASEPPGWWQRLGEALRVSRRGPALRALAAWQPASDQSHRNPSSSRPAMDIPTVLHSVARAEQRNPYLRADSLAELLAWHDLDFVRCAYVTVLGRQPDPIGEAYYVDRIRRGHSKLEILQQLRRSPEGPKHDPGIAGFDRALKKSVLQRQPLLGWFFRMLWPAPASIAPGEWQFRAMMNALEANAAAVGSIAAHLQILAQAPDSTNRSKEGSQAQAHSLVPEPTSPIGRCGARGAATRIVPELQHLRSRGPLAGYMARKLS